MPLSGQAKTEYQREYMRRRRSNGLAKRAKPATCSFCNDPGCADRRLVSDLDGIVFICEGCLAMALAMAEIAEARRL
jgi:hypothetical protein